MTCNHWFVWECSSLQNNPLNQTVLLNYWCTLPPCHPALFFPQSTNSMGPGSLLSSHVEWKVEKPIGEMWHWGLEERDGAGGRHIRKVAMLDSICEWKALLCATEYQCVCVRVWGWGEGVVLGAWCTLGKYSPLEPHPQLSFVLLLPSCAQGRE
jgi:hypothetical protein